MEEPRTIWSDIAAPAPASSPAPEPPTEAWAAAPAPLAPASAPPLEPRPPAPAFIEQPHTTNRPRGLRRQAALVLATSLLSAGLASTATVIAIAPALTTAPAPTATAGTGGSGAIQVSTSGGAAAAAPSPSADPIVSAVARVAPSVVTITSTVSSGQGRRAVNGTGVGSGIVYTSSGYILTNAHVVEGATSIKVALSDGRTFPATVVKSDANADIAVIKIDATGLTAASIGTSSGLQVGQTVIAIGSPLGDYTESVTTGVLSGTGRTITVADELTGQPRTLSNLLQTDAAINPGNSGGPLLDISGKVIGINSASATSASGLGFAIPIDAATALMSAAQLAA
jgi:S1-C subfamily serine protease